MLTPDIFTEKQKLFEEKYSKFIEPMYGNKRDSHDDENLMNDNHIPHEYSIPMNERIDLIHLEVYTIDPYGCTDADDAFSIFEEYGKLFNIHIADPTEFIKNLLYGKILKIK